MSNQHVQALENALSGERTHHTISFPATGDEELDCMNALISVINQFGKLPKQVYSMNDCRRVLTWFFQRTAHIHGLPMQVNIPSPPAQVPDYIFGSSTTPVAPICNPYYSAVGGASALQNMCNGLHDKPLML